MPAPSYDEINATKTQKQKVDAIATAQEAERGQRFMPSKCETFRGTHGAGDGKTESEFLSDVVENNR